MTSPSQPPNPYIVTKPGGLSTTEHAIHLLATLFTCGLWLPGYLAFIYFAPKFRYEVLVPFGADPATAQAAHAWVAAASRPATWTAEMRAAHDRKVRVVFIVYLALLSPLVIYGIYAFVVDLLD